MGRQPNRSRGGNNLSISDTFHNKHNSYNSKTFSSSTRTNKLGKHNPKRNKRYSEEKEFEEADDDDDEEDEEPTGVTRCICKLQHGDGVMIQCEECEVWQHIVCVNIPESEIPEKYFCEQCRPDLHPYLSKNEKPLPVKKSHKKPSVPITTTNNQTLPNNSIVAAISKVKSLSISASSSQKPKSTSNTPHQLDSPPSQIFTTRSGRQTAIRNKGTYLEVPEDADIDQVTEITEEALLANAEKKSQSSRRSKRSSPKPMSATFMAGPLSMSKASSNNSSNSLRRLDTYKNSIYPREMPNFPNFDALNEFFSPPTQAPKPPTYNPAPANSNKKKGNKRKSTPPPRARNVHARSQLNAIMIRADRMLGHCDVMVKELEETGLSILNPVKLNTLATGQNCIEAIEGLKRKLQDYKDQYENIRSRKEVKMD